MALVLRQTGRPGRATDIGRACSATLPAIMLSAHHVWVNLSLELGEFEAAEATTAASSKQMPAHTPQKKQRAKL